MLVYTADKKQFLKDVEDSSIDKKIEQQLLKKLAKKVSASERRSWMNSQNFMFHLLNDQEIPSNTGVAIEFNIPHTSKRIDFILSGLDEHDNKRALIIELKQWEKVQPLKGVEQLLQYNPEHEVTEIETAMGGSLVKTPHPSYQVSSYRSFLSDFNTHIATIPIHLSSCAYLHNYRPVKNDPLFQPYFEELLEDSPLYTRDDRKKLQDFIKRYIRKGDDKHTLYLIENGEIRPSKSLQDSLMAMLQGKEEFRLIDEQKIVYEQMLALSEQSALDNKKRVFIVKGGPGTGKTVVAINLLVQLTKRDQVVAYVTKNSAPRNVFEAKLKEGYTKKHISTLFKSSGAFIDAESGDYGTLIVDEAHRLNERSQYGPRIVGENQIKEIINAATCSFFFLDEDQKVTAKDYGRRDSIIHWAHYFDAEVTEGELPSQFRCNGSDGYLMWLDDVLGIRDQTAHPFLHTNEYDFKIFDNPTKMQQQIFEKNREDNKSRVVAGYCWPWISKKDSPDEADIVIDDFAMQWNLSNDSTYAISAGSINQVGCIHTTQGLEFNYVGVIIGDDLRYEDNKVITDFTKRAKTDTSLHGLIGPIRNGDQQALKEADEIIRNTYKTLMSRGLKGCYIYCTDQNLADFLASRLIQK
ncbi:MAG: DNA/RNA helicase domain-containing protein [Sphaerochaetaceae bacterium]|jgi:DUF2075 family protein